MQKTKAKHGSPVTGSRTRFVVLWVLIYFIGIFINQAFHATDPGRYLTINQANVVTFLLTVIPTLLQALIIERSFRRSMRGWVAFTMGGALITLLIALLRSPWTWSITANSDGFFWLTLSSIAPPVILQTIWLWRHSKFPWAWPALRAVRWLFWTGMTKLFPVPIDSTFIWLLTVLEILIEGTVMHTLLSHPKDTEKAKSDHAADEHSNVHHERLERLQERERSNPLWDTGDEQTLQSEA